MRIEKISPKPKFRHSRDMAEASPGCVDWVDSLNRSRYHPSGTLILGDVGKDDTNGH